MRRGRQSKQVRSRERKADGWIDGQTDGWMDIYVYIWIDRERYVHTYIRRSTGY